MSALVLAAAESTSKTPFYVLGGLLAVWAVLVSAVGIMRPDFPSNRGGLVGVSVLTAVLVVGAMASAVVIG
jgi:hypothetical protein